MDNTTQDSQSELFENNFGAWIESHGTDLDALHPSGRYKATVDLNKLKAAIINYAEAYVTTRVKEAERLARIDELKRLDFEDVTNRLSKLTVSFGEVEDRIEALTTTTNGKGQAL